MATIKLVDADYAIALFDTLEEIVLAAEKEGKELWMPPSAIKEIAREFRDALNETAIEVNFPEEAEDAAEQDS